MKKLTIAIIFLFSSVFSTTASAQESSQKQFNTHKTEFNIAISNIFAKNNLWPYYYVDIDGIYLYPTYSIWGISPMTELMVGFKFHNPKGAFRLGSSFHYSNRKNEEVDGQMEIQKYDDFNIELYVGYEWHSTFNRVNIFYGFDVSSGYWNNYFNSEGQSRTSEYRVNEISIGVNPLAGINFFITPHLSIGTEAKFMMEYASGKSKSTSTDYYGQNESESKTSGFRTRFGPLGFLSINIHF